MKEFELDNQRILHQKIEYEKNLKTRPKVQGFQIGSNSDMVMNEKFESDSQRVCESLKLDENSMINFEGFV